MDNTNFAPDEVTKICDIIKCIYDRNLPLRKFTEEFMHKLKTLIYFDKSDFMFYKFDDSTGYYEMEHFIPTNWSRKEIYDYMHEHMHNDDVLPILSQPEYIAFRNSDIFSLTGRRKTDYFQQFAQEASLEISIDANIPLPSDYGIVAIIGIFRSIEKVAFSQRDLEIIKMLQPHLSERMKIDVAECECLRDRDCENGGKRNVPAEEKSFTSDWALDNIDTFGISVFDVTGNIVNSNASFSEFCEKYSGDEDNPLIKTIKKHLFAMTSKGILSIGPVPVHADEDTYMIQLTYNDMNKEYVTVAVHYTSELFSKRLAAIKHDHMLTNREFEIIWLSLKKCMTNSEISQELFISEATVKRHLYTAYQKVGVKNHKQLFQELQMI